MDEYSIETRFAAIYDGKTKEYFAEVISSYQQGNYRSATVMLWSVAVCDLLHKLKHLVDMYGDSIASGIISEVRQAQADNPRSSDWEYKLVEKIFERTHLLEVADIDHFSHLQQQRHLAAHPVLSRDMELHRPNKETVRALIRNTLDGLLTKPPIFTQKVFEEFVADIAASAPMLIDDSKLKSYLESKYLRRSDTKVELSLARSLWKLVFRLSNAQCDTNRQINFRALMLLFERNREAFSEMVRGEPDYFSNVAAAGAPVEFLVRFLSKQPTLYDLLNASAHVVIDHEVETSPTSRCIGLFARASLDEHASAIMQWLDGDDEPEISSETLVEMSAISDSAEWSQRFHNICSTYYCKSYSYNMADSRFREAIEPFLTRFDQNDLRVLLEQIEQNGQCYGRGAAARDHTQIKTRLDEIGDHRIELREFPNFVRSCADS